jgi:hypothetical protein
MMALVSLGVLLLVDGAGVGWRAAAGRSARIDKRRWYLVALGRGVMYAALVGVLALAVAIAGGELTTTSTSEGVARKALLVYAPFVGLGAVCAVVRALGSVDARSIASTLVFGPLTLARPLVLLAGAWPALAAGGLTASLAGGVVAAMLVAEPLLARWTPAPDG